MQKTTRYIPQFFGVLMIVCFPICSSNVAVSIYKKNIKTIMQNFVTIIFCIKIILYGIYSIFLRIIKASFFDCFFIHSTIYCGLCALLNSFKKQSHYNMSKISQSYIIPYISRYKTRMYRIYIYSVNICF